MRLKDVEATVNQILIQYPETRDNENELVFRFLVAKHMPTDYCFLRQYSTSIAETVCRARRKCVERNPNLQENRRVTARRRAREEEYRERMRGV